MCEKKQIWKFESLPCEPYTLDMISKMDSPKVFVFWEMFNNEQWPNTGNQTQIRSSFNTSELQNKGIQHNPVMGLKCPPAAFWKTFGFTVGKVVKVLQNNPETKWQSIYTYSKRIVYGQLSNHARGKHETRKVGAYAL